MSSPSLRAVPSHDLEAGHADGASEDLPPKSKPIADSQKWRTQPAQVQAHRDVIRLVTMALGATGCTQEKAARILGVSERNVQMLLDPAGTKRLSASALFLLAKNVAGFGEAISLALAAQAPAPRPTAPRSLESHAMRLSAVVGDLAERLDEALADGKLSQAERHAIARLHCQVIERCKAALRDLGEA